MKNQIVDYLTRQTPPAQFRAAPCPVAILLTGESGSGKTTVAGHLTRVFDFVYLSNEVLRAAVLPCSRFTHEEDLLFFSALDEAALHFLSCGRSVLWDARFPKHAIRNEKREFFAAHGYPAIFLCVYTLERLRIQRLVHRERSRPECLSPLTPCYTKDMISSSTARSCPYEPVAAEEPNTFSLANIDSPLRELAAFVDWLEQRRILNASSLTPVELSRVARVESSLRE